MNVESTRLDDAPAAAVELAVLLCHASRIERTLLRRTRLTLAPHLDADAEADLWNSSLADVRGIDGLLLRHDVLDPLRAVAANRFRGGGADAQRLTRARELVQEFHGSLVCGPRFLPDLVLLEELIAWNAIEGTDHDHDELLRPALRSLIEQDRRGIARWAARALPRLPASARSTESAGLLAQVSARIVGRPITLDGGPALTVAALATVVSSLGTVRIGVRRIGDMLELGSIGPGGHAIEVPDSDPRVVDIGVNSTTRTVSIGRDTLEEVETGWGSVALVDGSGTSWMVPDADAGAQGLAGAMVDLDNHDGRDGPDGRDGRVQGLVVDDGLILVIGDSQIVERPTTVEPISLATTVEVGALLHGFAGRRAVSIVGIAGEPIDALTINALVRSPAGPDDLSGAPLTTDDRLVGVIVSANSIGNGWVEVRVRSVRAALAAARERRAASAPTVRLLPASYGSSILVGWGNADERHHLLFDTGPKQTSKRIADLVVEHAGGHLDLIIVSHADANVSGGFDRLLGDNRLTVTQSWMNNADEQSPEPFDETLVVNDDGPLPRHELPGGMIVTVLGPTRHDLRAQSARREAL